jgi:hypothetical protein
MPDIAGDTGRPVTGFRLLALVDERHSQLWDEVVPRLPRSIALTCLDLLPSASDCPHGPYALLATGSAAPMAGRGIAALPAPTRLVLIDPEPPTGWLGKVPAISVIGQSAAIPSLLVWRPCATEDFEIRLLPPDLPAAAALARDHVVDSLRLWW